MCKYSGACGTLGAYITVATPKFASFGNTNSDILRYIEHPPMRDSTSLLLLNHQLHEETQDAIRLLPTKSFVLDVIIAHERKLWATWLYAPVLTTRVDRVYTTIRTIGRYKKGSSLFAGGDGGPPQITMSFYNLIERGLRVGPVGRRTKKDDKKISIKELVIDVRTPDVPSSKILPMQHCEQRRKEQYRKENGPDYLLHPAYILGYVRSEIGMLLNMSYHSASYGALLYERIGCIKVLMDGELHEEWDLAQCLADVKFNDSFGRCPRETRREVFSRWKLQAYQTRIELGLPVMPLKGGKDEKEGSSSV